jgi:c(7)-type cytochrome triheme protein
MRYIIGLFVALCVICGLSAVAQEKKPPAKLVLKAKTGNVTYDHAAHAKRAKNDCKVCHDKLWPQSAAAPLNFKAAMHKTAEANKTSCGACHHAGGTAFETKGNCTKCHVKAGVKS